MYTWFYLDNINGSKAKQNKSNQTKNSVLCLHTSTFFWLSTKINSHYLSVLGHVFSHAFFIDPSIPLWRSKHEKTVTGIIHCAVMVSNFSPVSHPYSSSIWSQLCHYCLFSQLRHKVCYKLWNPRRNISIRHRLLKNSLLCSRLKDSLNTAEKCSLHSNIFDDDN